MMLKKKVLLISNPKLKKYYKKIITTYGSKLENIDENYSIFKKKIPEFTAVVSLPSYFVKAEIFNLAKQLDWIHFGGAGIENALIPELINSNIADDLTVRVENWIIENKITRPEAEKIL